MIAECRRKMRLVFPLRNGNRRPRQATSPDPRRDSVNGFIENRRRSPIPRSQNSGHIDKEVAVSGHIRNVRTTGASPLILRTRVLEDILGLLASSQFLVEIPHRLELLESTRIDPETIPELISRQRDGL
jgi:hypothetical protein